MFLVTCHTSWFTNRDPLSREQSFQEFQRVAGFPGVLGVLDCVQVFFRMLKIYKYYCSEPHLFSVSVSFGFRWLSRLQPLKTYHMWTRRDFTLLAVSWSVMPKVCYSVQRLIGQGVWRTLIFYRAPTSTNKCKILRKDGCWVRCRFHIFPKRNTVRKPFCVMSSRWSPVPSEEVDDDSGWQPRNFSRASV